MANYYVHSAAAGGNGTTWALAYKTLALALAGKVGGDNIWIAHDHDEANAGALAFGAPSGGFGNPVKVCCVDRAGSVPPVAADFRTTAKINSALGISIGVANSGIYYEGINFTAGVASAAALNFIFPHVGNCYLRFDNCTFYMASTSGSCIFKLGNGTSGPGGLVELNNCGFQFGHINQYIEVSATVRWRNTAVPLLGAIYPFIALRPVSNMGGSLEMTGLDFSAVPSGKNITTLGAAATAFKIKATDCIFGASTKGGAPGGPGQESEFVRSPDLIGGEKVTSAGNLAANTAIYRNGGAMIGSTPFSWVAFGGTGANFFRPFDMPPIAIWNETVGEPITATVEGLANPFLGGTPNKNDHSWITVDYLGNASDTVSSSVSSRKASFIDAAVGYPASDATWTGLVSGAPGIPFSMSVTFTPQQAGWFYVYLKCQHQYLETYFDPVVTLS